MVPTESGSCPPCPYGRYGTAWSLSYVGWGAGEGGVPQNINRAHCAVLRPDQFKFASYGLVIPHLLTATGLSTVQLGLDTINHSADRFQYSAQGTYRCFHDRRVMEF